MTVGELKEILEGLGDEVEVLLYSRHLWPYETTRLMYYAIEDQGVCYTENAVNLLISLYDED